MITEKIKQLMQQIKELESEFEIITEEEIKRRIKECKEEDYKDTHPLDSEEKEKKQDDGCPDCFCEDCDKEDCLWKELGIINKH